MSKKNRRLYTPTRFMSLPLLATSMLALTQCDKKPEATSATTSAAPASAVAAVKDLVESAVTKAPTLQDKADKLGFAASLSADSELYVGSVNLKAHLDALKKSSYYKEINKIIEDKTPAASDGEASIEPLKKLWGDDIFISGGPGLADSFTQLVEFNRIYNEATFKGLMAGQASNLGGGGSANSPLIIIQALLSDQQALERLGKVVSELEVPPLLIGVKTEKPEERIAELFAPDVLSKLQEQKFVISDFKTPEGYDFKVATLELKDVLSEEQQKEALGNLPPFVSDQARQVIEKAWDAIQTKKIQIAWGSVKGHLVLSLGKSLDHLKFAAGPESSLLSKAEFANLLPHADKDLMSLFYFSANTLNAARDDKPLLPMLKGVVSALKENETFGQVGAKLEGEVAQLAPLESAVFQRENTSFVGASWWDKGFHAESFGGPKPAAFTSGKPLNYLGLVEQPGTVFGAAYHRNPAYEKAVRAWAEKLVGVIYAGVQEAVKSGILGPEGGQQFAMFELLALPTLKQLYQSNKDIDEKGLGSELAFILDVNGKMPPLPSMPADPNVKFPRLTMVSDVGNREEIAKGWSAISSTITNLASIVGAQAAGPGAPPFVVPTPVSEEKDGLTYWTYQADFFNGDLYPVSALNDKVLFLSTSKEAATSYAASIATAPATKLDGLVWRFDFAALSAFLNSSAGVLPDQTPEGAKELRQNLKWIKPFQTLKGHHYEANGQGRATLDWEITDVVNFD